MGVSWSYKEAVVSEVGKMYAFAFLIAFKNSHTSSIVMISSFWLRLENEDLLLS